MKKPVSHHLFVLSELRRYRRNLFFRLPGTFSVERRPTSKFWAIWILTRIIQVAKLVDPLTLRDFVLRNRRSVKQPYYTIWTCVYKLLTQVYDFQAMVLNGAIDEGRIKTFRGGKK